MFRITAGRLAALACAALVVSAPMTLLADSALLTYKGSASTYAFGSYLTTIANSSSAQIIDMAVDASGDVFVLDGSGSQNGNCGTQIAKVTATGSASIVVPTCPANGISSLGVDGSGNLYYIGVYQGAVGVEKVTPEGVTSTLLTLGQWQSLMSNNALQFPQFVGVDAAGDVLVADGSGDVGFIAANGAESSVTMPSSPNSGTTASVYDVAIDASGNGYVLINDTGASTSFARVVKITAGSTTGQNLSLGSYGAESESSPSSLAVAPDGDIYIADDTNQPGQNYIYRVTGGVSEIAVFGSTVFNAPNKVRVSPAGVVYALDYDNSFSALDPRLGSSALFANVLFPPNIGASFGTIAVGSASAPLEAAFLASAAGADINSIQYLTAGATGGAFAAAPETTSPCPAAGTVSALSYCYLKIQVTPASAGLQLGGISIGTQQRVEPVNAPFSVNGAGPMVNYLQPFVTTLLAPGAMVGGEALAGPAGIAVDGNGNVFVADEGNNRIVEISGGVGSTFSINTPLDNPNQVAVDGFGNVYASGYTGGGGLVEITPSDHVQVVQTGAYSLNFVNGLAIDPYQNLVIAGTSGTGPVFFLSSQGGNVSAIPGGLVDSYVSAAATDGSGNLYFTDTGSGIVNIVSPSGSLQTVNTVGLPYGLAVDAAGDIYSGSNLSGKIDLSSLANNSVENVLPAGSPVQEIGGMARDSLGNLYVTDALTGGVYEWPIGTAPTLDFASTNVGQPSSDSPQSVVLLNAGSSALTASGPGLSVGAGFDQVTGPGTPADCTATFNLAPTVQCNLSISFEPTATGTDDTSVTLTDNNLNVSSAMQNILLQGTGTTSGPVAPVITWNTPVAITYGTVLGSSQLNATATYNGNPVNGTFTYSPAAGSLLSAGANQVLTVTFVPSDQTTYSTPPATTTTLTVYQAAVNINWTAPQAIIFGTALSSSQLNATFSDVNGNPLPGVPVYSPAAGVKLGAGANQTLSVSFTPTDTTDYISPAAASTTITVNKAVAALNWIQPSAITYGTELSATQLDATATAVDGSSLGGTFTYTPTAGTLLNAGANQVLSVSFTPTDTTDYSSTTTNTTITVNKATPTLSWTAPSAITYGTTLSGTQLNATATGVNGTTLSGGFTFSPSAGTMLGAGANQTLSASFIPADITDYVSPDTVTTAITVNQAKPTISWTAPAAITYGTLLSGTQLNAKATGVTGQPLPGNYSYLPAAGTELSAGANQLLSVTFTSTDAADYQPASLTTSITVNQVAPSLSWTAPAPIVYGTALTSTQLDAVASGVNGPLNGKFAYTPAAGTILSVGTGETLSATFAPSDTTDYGSGSVTTAISVTPALLTVTGPNLSRVYGTANPSLPAGVISGEITGDGITSTSSTPAVPLSPVIAGGYPILNTLTDPNSKLSNYSVTNTAGALTITQAPTALSLIAGSSMVTPGQTVTLTATVTSSTTGTPTQSVTFLDGSTPLGTELLAGGQASLTVALASGTHQLTAKYTGDQNFLASSSSVTANSTVVVAPLDFTFTIGSGSQTAQTVLPGSNASYTLNIAPLYGSFPAEVTFSATGLPTGATIVFNPSTLPADSTGSSLMLTLTLPTLQTENHGFTLGRAGSLLLGFILLPWALQRRLRRAQRRLLGLLLFVLSGLAAIGTLSGCGSGNGLFGQVPASYTITVTATSGSITHSTNVSLNVE